MWYCGLFTIPTNNATATYNHMSSKFVGFYKENIEHMLLFIIAWIGDILVKSLHIYWYYQQHFEYNHQLEMFFELT